MYSKGYINLRTRIVNRTNKKRAEYRNILKGHLQNYYHKNLLEIEDINSLDGVCFILSASRGGSSIFIDILKQQAQSSQNKGKKIFSLPGEQKPYVVLAKLTPPFKDFPSDRLDKINAQNHKSKILLSELASEIGFPIQKTSDTRGFAITIYGRLLLQWPTINFGASKNAIQKIEEVVKSVSILNDGVYNYVDQSSVRKDLMTALKETFSQIDLRLYDGIVDIDSKAKDLHLVQYDSFIEEPPFIIPTPWHFVSNQELAQGVLLLKDPSDAWRILFWKELFTKTPLSWIHLTRNVYESINGLCDGWKFPLGYFTTKSPSELNIKGYTNKTSLWTKWYVKYSTSDKEWRLLLKNNSVDLECIAAHQWLDAHLAIVEQVGKDPNYYRLANKENNYEVGFEWLRSNPIEAITQVCERFGFEISPSLIEAAQEIANRKVQVTPGTNDQSDRWKKASNHDLITLYASGKAVEKMSEKLGYTFK